jgi:prepilin-type N-terminal cleavage/methylation domain-containing protein
MRSTATSRSICRRLAVEWREQADARPQKVELRVAPQQSSKVERRSVVPRNRGPLRERRCGQASAFTLLELMMVVAIVGFLAAMTLPHVGGYNRANSLMSASRQVLDAVARARSQAMVSRSVVYMVFVPSYSAVLPKIEQQVSQISPQLTNLLGHQYMSYALLSARSVGDQPGQHYAHYSTEWQTLPKGVYFWPTLFNHPTPSTVNVYTTNTFANTVNYDLVSPLPTNSFPFPTATAGTSMNLPYIAFSPDGTLAAGEDQYVMLSRGSIFSPTDTNGNYLVEPPNIVETPPNNALNNPCMIKIDWLTSRGTIVQNQFQ